MLAEIAQPGVDSSNTLAVLLDESVRVSVVFGHTSLPLQKIVKLTTGSVLELGGSLRQPVEIVVNNRVIASGEVVVVEGNYGVRILTVVSREERLDIASNSGA
jgi:flagellar motor switch protein FliN/FliY